jgi:hypothetical protein
MRRLIAVAGFLVLAASVQVAAQHGGGHGSAGGHGGGFASHGSFGGGHAFSGSHSSSGFAPRSYARGSSTFRAPRASRNFNSRGFNRSNNLRIRTYGFRNNCYGYACRGYGYPWGYGAFDPWWWDSGSSYDQDQQNQIGLAQEMNQQNLDEQRMREQGDQDVYARLAPPPPHQEERTEAAPATVLIFRDQRRQEVQNYAIVGQTLWNFVPQHTEKIPLSDLDIPATTKANDERGISFRLPGGNEGQ